MSVLICLGGGIEGLPIIARAKAMGLKLVVVDGRADAPGMHLADVPVVASCYDAAATADAINLGYHPDGVICAATDSPNVAAFVAQEFDLPGLTPEQAQLSVDKLAQKTALRAASLPVPAFGAVDYAPLKTERTGADIVIKPVDSRGARGVTRVGPRQPYKDAFNIAKQNSPSGRVMYEHYLTGPQLSTESIVVDGRVLFTAIALRNYERFERGEFGSHPIEDGFDMTWGENYAWEIDQAITQGCAALGWFQAGANGGTVKADLIVHEGRIVILELAARLSGGFLCMAHEWVYGVDFIEAAIGLALGEKISVSQCEPSFHVCQRYLFPEPGDVGRRVVSVPDIGTLSSMLGEWKYLERLKPNGKLDELVGIRHATYAVRPGDVLRPVTDHGARLGQCIAVGRTPDDARQRAEQAVKSMKSALILK